MNSKILYQTTTSTSSTSTTSTIIGTSTSTTSTIIRSAQYARPDADVDNSGSWVFTPLWSKIGEITPSDLDLIYKYVTNGTYSTATIGLSNVVDPLVDSEHIIRFRIRRFSATSQTLEFKIRLLQGTTQIASYTLPVTSTLFITYSYALTAAEAASIIDYNDLRLEIAVREVLDGTSTYVDLSWAEFEVPSP